MESLFILIPLSILAVAAAAGVFFWMNHDGQFDDDQGPAWSILLDDDRPEVDRQGDALSKEVTHISSDHAEERRG